jgi:hypothetical protein
VARHCSVCSHEQRKEIDEQLVSGASYRSIGERFDLGREAVRRHCERHVSPALTAVRGAALEARRASVLDRVELLIERAERLFNEAAAEGRFSQSLDALRELRLQVELLGKATGELNDRPQVVVNVLATPEWLSIRGAIFSTLADYPDARAALSGRLLELEEKKS